jgi:hypothetical protein
MPQKITAIPKGETRPILNNFMTAAGTVLMACSKGSRIIVGDDLAEVSNGIGIPIRSSDSPVFYQPTNQPGGVLMLFALATDDDAEASVLVSDEAPL